MEKKRMSGYIFPRWLWMQRLGLLLFGGLGIALLVYSLGFITDVYVFFAYGGRKLAAFYNAMQELNQELLKVSLFVITGIVVLFILELWKFPAGPLTLLITILVSGIGIFFSAGLINRLFSLRLEYTMLDLSSLNRYIRRGTIVYEASTLTYDLGMLLYGLFCCVSLFLIIIVLVNACAGRPVSELRDVSDETV